MYASNDFNNIMPNCLQAQLKRAISHLALLDLGPWVGLTQTKMQLTLEVVQQTSVAHQLRHNIDGLLQRTHGIELDKFRVPQALHDLSLS